jgi:hypothetical protein
VQSVWTYSKAVAAIDRLGLAEKNIKFAHYWLSLWDGDKPPTRARLEPHSIPDLLPGTALIEVRANLDPICRLSGTAIDIAIGRPLTGANLLDFVSDEGKAIRQSRASTIVEGSASVSRTPYLQSGKTKVIETVQLPFCGMTEDVSRLYMAHTNWRPSDGFAIPPRPSEPLGFPESFRIEAFN